MTTEEIDTPGISSPVTTFATQGLAPLGQTPMGTPNGRPTVSIVLPCYNEEGHVVAEVERITAAMDASGYNYELLAVDDCSTDSTLAKLYEIAPHFPRMDGRPLPAQRRLGHGAADRHAARRAVTSSCGPTPT